MTDKPLFGGKAPVALEWRPLPHMEEYLDNLRADDKTPSYIRSTKLALTRFALFLESEGVRHPDEITRSHILRYQSHLAEQDLKVTYRQQMLKLAGIWIRWLQDVEHIDHNPWVRIRVGRVTKKPKPLENDEIASLFAAHKQQAFSLAPFYYHRREVILVLLLGWGLRLHELRALTVASLDMRLEWVIVRNKGGGTKTLPFGDEMKQVVNRYLNHRVRKPGEDALLVDQYGNQLSQDMIYRTVVELGSRANVTINPHRLRDTCGTILLDEDVPVERIMKILGHTQRAQTMAYSRVNEPKVKESHDAVMNPLFQKLLGGKLP